MRSTVKIEAKHSFRITFTHTLETTYESLPVVEVNHLHIFTWNADRREREKTMTFPWNRSYFWGWNEWMVDYIAKVLNIPNWNEMKSSPSARTVCVSHITSNEIKMRKSFPSKAGLYKMLNAWNCEVIICTAGSCHKIYSEKLNVTENLHKMNWVLYGQFYIVNVGNGNLSTHLVDAINSILSLPFPLFLPILSKKSIGFKFCRLTIISHKIESVYFMCSA